MVIARRETSNAEDDQSIGELFSQLANDTSRLVREETEIGSMLLGTEELDDDLMMKIRGLKQQRDEEGESDNAREFN